MNKLNKIIRRLLQDIGFTHISFYVDDFDNTLAQVKQAGGIPVSEPHTNTRYEDTVGNQTVYIKTPWGVSLSYKQYLMAFIIRNIAKQLFLYQSHKQI